MKKRVWINFLVILGIILLIGAIFNTYVIAEVENDFSYSYDYYNFEGAFVNNKELSRINNLNAHVVFNRRKSIIP